MSLRRLAIINKSLYCRTSVTRTNHALSQFSASLPFSTVISSDRNTDANTNDSSDNDKEYDIIVGGGGVVGAVFVADLLTHIHPKVSSSKIQHLKIGIVDLRPPPPLPTSSSSPPSIRVYAMSPKSIATLQRIGAWEYIKHRSQPFKSMQVWESNGPGLVRFNENNNNSSSSSNNGSKGNGSDEDGERCLGRIVEDSVVHAAVYEAMKDRGWHVDMLFGKTISSIENATSSSPSSSSSSSHQGPLSVTLSSISPPSSSSSSPSSPSLPPQRVQCKLLVGADGAMSTVRRLTGMGTWGWSYGQEAIVATVKLNSSTSHEATAWQKYLRTGPLALLPLWDGYASIVWSTSVSECKRLKALPKEDFLAELNSCLQSSANYNKYTVKEEESSTRPFPFLPSSILKSVRKEVGGFVDVMMSASQISNPYRSPPLVAEIYSDRISFPLQFQQANEYARQGIALIGDAAHSIHPQAGQGLNLGIADAADLAEIIFKNAIENGSSEMSDYNNVLAKYARKRSLSNLAMMGTVDILHRIFNDTSPFSVVHKHSNNNSSNEINNCNSNSYSNCNSSGNGLIAGKQLARSIGMLAMHGSGSLLKERIAKFAMGL